MALEDILAADGAAGLPGPAAPRAADSGPLQINWVIPAIAPGAGGHGNILRFARALEARGHRCTLHIYDPHGYQTQGEARAIARRHFPAMRAEIRHGLDGVGDCDALLATAWQTAYPVFNAQTGAARFYFVQDYEPWFHPVGSTHVLAEATYGLGLHGITLGQWLADKLSVQHGMRCDAFPFGSDPGVYRLEGGQRRDKVLFYARPHTPRRGFELGVMALELFSRAHPELEINLLGGDLGGVTLPFAAVERGILSTAELNALYNESAAALVLSFTNTSLVPLELLAAGCVPVVNEGENNRANMDNPEIVHSDPAPHALARALCAVVEDPDRDGRARRAAASVQTAGWDEAVDRVEQVLLGVLAAPAVAT